MEGGTEFDLKAIDDDDDDDGGGDDDAKNLNMGLEKQPSNR